MTCEKSNTSKNGMLIQFRYKLAEAECLECLWLMDSPKNGRAKKVNELVVFVLAAACLVFYLLRPQMLSYLLLALALTVTLFILHYLPDFRRKRKAKKMAGQKGEYRFTLMRDGRIKAENLGEACLYKKGCRLYQGPSVYLICVDEFRFCIPKREIPSRATEEFKALLRDSGLEN